MMRAFLGLEPKACLAIEDALAGIDAAAAGGFASAGLGEAATHANVNYPLGSFADILNGVE